MAFFKFRKNSSLPSQDEPGTRGESAAPVETVANLRRRALYRLIGAAVLVLAAIIGFPMLFDTQPRPPMAVQAPIVIPDRNTAPPLTLPASKAVAAPGPSAPSQAPAAASLSTEEELIEAPDGRSASGAIAPAAGATAPPATSDTAAQQARQQLAQERQAAKRAAEKRKADEQAQRQRDWAADAARARALLGGRNAPPPPPAASSSAAPARPASAHAQEKGGYMIQIGAFASAQSAQAVRQKAERAGVKAYTQPATTKTGAVVRVRAGPFASRDEAARALSKLKQAGMSGSIVGP
jgi:DedD protein